MRPPIVEKYTPIYSSSEYAEGWVVGTEPKIFKISRPECQLAGKVQRNLSEGTALVEAAWPKT